MEHLVLSLVRALSPLDLALLLTRTTVRLPSASKPCTQTTAAMLGKSRVDLNDFQQFEGKDPKNTPGANNLQNKSSGNVRGHGNSGLSSLDLHFDSFQIT